MISLDETFLKYDDNESDRNRAHSIISTSTAFSFLPSDSPRFMKSMTPHDRTNQSDTIVDNDISRNGENNLNDTIHPLNTDTEPVSLVKSFLSLFNSPVNLKTPKQEIVTDTDDNIDDCPTVDRQPVQKRLSWSEGVKVIKEENETRDRGDSITSQTTMATDDGTFVSYYNFQSNVIKALLYEV